MFIESFIYQRCIGYNEDFSITYFVGLAKFSDGSEKLVYSQHEKTPNGFETIGEWEIKERPHVAIKN